MDNLLTREEVAKILSVKIQTLAKWAMERRGPAVVKVGRAVRYRESDVRKIVESGTANEPQEAKPATN